MGGDMLCLGCILRKENPAPQARIVRGFNPPASAACEFSMGSDTFYNKRRFLWEVIRSIMSKRFYGEWCALFEL